MNNPELSLKCNSNFSSKIVDVIICFESKYLIIERIDNDIFNNLMNNLTKSGIKVIKASNKAFNDNQDESNEIREEIRNCFEFFQYKIDNFFVKSTFFPIMGYLIGRYYCPTEYFNDPSFFIFKNSSKNNEFKTQTIIKDIVFSNPGELDPYEMSKVYTDVKINSFSYSILNNDSFDPDDFIVLRNIYSNSNASFNLVMHIKSLYLFMVKEIAHPERIEKEFEHEKQFCLFYRHRCINKFYGFLKKQEQIFGFVYEYMCNGSLYTFIKSNKENVSKLFSFTTILRIFQGIQYLQLESLIHRDLKPANILLDNDYLPYITDFETIRLINEEDNSSYITNDIGSPLYLSPEQNEGKNISFPTDIYSFGLIIYFLFEKKILKIKDHLMKLSKKW